MHAHAIKTAVLAACCAAGLGLSPPAAAQYTCTGTVVGLVVSPSGIVSGQSIGGLPWQSICQLGSAANGVSPDACKAVYAMLLSAQISGKTVTFWFSDAGTCSTHYAWTWLTGWYYGPMIQ